MLLLHPSASVVPNSASDWSRAWVLSVFFFLYILQHPSRGLLSGLIRSNCHVTKCKKKEIMIGVKVHIQEDKNRSSSHPRAVFMILRLTPSFFWLEQNRILAYHHKIFSLWNCFNGVRSYSVIPESASGSDRRLYSVVCL